MSNHNFELFINTDNKSYKVKVGYRLWNCAGCDTIIMYPNHYSQRLVNQLVDKSNLIHIPTEKN